MRKIYSIPFGADFLAELKRLVTDDGRPLSKKAVVFSGKRPSIYFKRILSQGCDRPFFPPRCFSIDEFIDYIVRRRFYDFTDLEEADAVWLLYGVTRSMKIFQGHPFTRSFGDFFYWGRHILGFINQLDMEDVPRERLPVLEGSAKIGYDVPVSVNELLGNIGAIREKFHETLLKKRYFTAGYKSLKAQESVDEILSGEFETIWFAGLFALSRTERRIIRKIWLSGMGEIAFEGSVDEWPILKELIPSSHGQIEYLQSATSRPERIRVYSAFDTHSQVLKVHDIVKDLKSKKTALVLPLSEALFPLLTFGADRWNKRYNISLGYPFERTPVFDLVKSVINAQTTRRRGIYYGAREYLHVILNPFVKNLDVESDRRHLILDIEQSIKGEAAMNKAFVRLEEIEREWERLDGGRDSGDLESLRETHRIFFRGFEDVGNIKKTAERMEEMLAHVLLHTSVRSYILSGEIFKALFQCLETLKGCLFSGERFFSDEEKNRKTLYDFTLGFLGNLNLSFETRPVEELEIIGVLETRNLVFDTVIVLDVNEGVIPQPKKIDPLIPIGVYEGLGIPAPERNEEIYRYHFSRLVASAGDVRLLYVDSADKQRSRYIENILWEEEKRTGRLNAIPVESSSLEINLKSREEPPDVRKTDIVLERIRGKVFSPSSMDDYILCPVLFYYSHILNLEKKREISHDIDGLDRGTIIHGILHDALLPFKGREIKDIPRGEVLHSLRDAVNSRFEGRVVSGDYYLFRRIAEFKLEKFLEKNIFHAEKNFIIEELEMVMSAVVDVDMDGTSTAIRGRIDRIDLIPDDGEYMIIDYKTGGVRQNPGKILDKTDFSSILDIHENGVSLQMPIYVHLLHETLSIPHGGINAKLILLGKNEEEPLFVNDPPEAREALMERCMEGVRTVLRDMLDPAKPFRPFDDRACGACLFNDLCRV